ncbi:sulfite exporter TauE/SafE family protein [Patulibacter sp.]|uniref:sulfite exporter TauE/SafE family protein n=1 Tax=Patulibacter sp. TaxID=1912859 RepID=UPI002726F967|nr:sulfite exporter TauE/SafE family protein [Patulibacter sp.]MDO9410269.1 sulfite exporter TauE/SafE family protein [Patulibacter sp.]
MDRRRTAKIAGIGTVAGLFSGLFGVGGGVVMVPLLLLLLGMDERRATSTSLGAIVIIATAATLTQGAYGTVHLTEGLLVGVPALAGVVAGTALQQRLPAKRVSLIFAVLLIGVAASMVLSTGDADGGGADLDATRVALAAVFGFAAGVVSGLLGVGGGTLFVPGLIYVLGLGHVEAEATSLLAMVPMSLLGAWRQHRYGNLEVRTSVTMGVLAIPGALLGVVLANALPVRVLEVGFALLLLYVAQRLARRGLAKEVAPA